MGRKKIQISRITDERNRQVSSATIVLETSINPLDLANEIDSWRNRTNVCISFNLGRITARSICPRIADSARVNRGVTYPISNTPLHQYLRERSFTCRVPSTVLLLSFILSERSSMLIEFRSLSNGELCK